jgi:hemoglobin
MLLVLGKEFTISLVGSYLFLHEWLKCKTHAVLSTVRYFCPAKSKRSLLMNDTRPDIRTREDIEKLMVNFYEKVKHDPVIGFFFNEVVKMDWLHHIPVIVDFWETILLDNHVYAKNAMEVHYALNRKSPIGKEHFDRWLELFSGTVNEMHQGPTAELAKTRARSIASLMQFKMLGT